MNIENVKPEQPDDELNQTNYMQLEAKSREASRIPSIYRSLIVPKSSSHQPENTDSESPYINTIGHWAIELQVRHCGQVVSAPARNGTGREFDSWQCRIYIPCSLSLRLLESLRSSLGTYGLTQKFCLKKSWIYFVYMNKLQYSSILPQGEVFISIQSMYYLSVSSAMLVYHIFIASGFMNSFKDNFPVNIF